MNVSKQWLENKVKELNEWLLENTNHLDYGFKKHSRDFYVKKLIELEEKQLETIKV